MLVRHSPEAAQPVATRSPSSRRPLQDRQRQRQQCCCPDRPRGVPSWQCHREFPNPARRLGGML